MTLSLLSLFSLSSIDDEDCDVGMIQLNMILSSGPEQDNVKSYQETFWQTVWRS